jgi:50S ribosomal protein L16 3-hydroxylase
MMDLINEPEHFRQWFGEFISQSRHELDVAPPEPPYQADEIYDALQQGDKLTRLAGCACCALVRRVRQRREAGLTAPTAPAIASHLVLTADTFGDALEDPSSSRCWPRWSTAVLVL